MSLSQSEAVGKERLKWTQDLHDMFEKAVNQLGGPDRSTPKGILKTMGISGLTIYHVKSHLQKYRMSKLIPESSKRDRFEKRSMSEKFPNISASSGAQLDEALQMQMEVQRRLSDQLEVQKSLKLKIEAQSRFLERIAEEYKSRLSISKSNKSFSPTSLPSLCDESDVKEFDSDSEVNKNEIQSQDELQATKRRRIDDDNEVSSQRFKSISIDRELYSSSMPLLRGMTVPFQTQENSFPWMAFCNSPLIPASYSSSFNSRIEFPYEDI